MAEKVGMIETIRQRFAYDYETSTVPLEARQSNWSQMVIWICFPCQLATIISGGLVGLGLGLRDGLIAILIGNFILACISLPIGIAAQRMNISSAMLTRFSFGHRGTWGPSMVAGLVMMGWLMWMSFIGGTSGNIIGTFMGGPGWANGGFIIGLIVAMLIGIFATLYGYAGPKWVGYGTAVFMTGVTIAIIVMVINQVGGGWTAANAAHETYFPMSMAFAIGLVIGSWINGTVMCGDFTRFCRRPTGVIAGPFLGLFVWHTFVLFAGCVAANLSELARTEALLGQIIAPTLAIGGVLFGLGAAMYVLTTVNTMPPTLYTACVEYFNVFKRNRITIVIVTGCIAAALGAMIQYVSGAKTTMAVWLPFVTHVMPTYGGVMIADFWLVNRGHYPSAEEFLDKAKQFVFNPIGYISWAGAAAVNVVTTNAANAQPEAGFIYGIPGLNGLIAAILIYWFLMTVTRQKWMYWRKWIPSQ